MKPPSRCNEANPTVASASGSGSGAAMRGDTAEAMEVLLASIKKDKDWQKAPPYAAV